MVFFWSLADFNLDLKKFTWRIIYLLMKMKWMTVCMRCEWIRLLLADIIYRTDTVWNMQMKWAMVDDSPNGTRSEN